MVSLRGTLPSIIIVVLVFVYLLQIGSLAQAVAGAVWVIGIGATTSLSLSIQSKSSRNSKDESVKILHQSDMLNIRETLGRILVIVAFVTGAGLAIAFISPPASFPPILWTAFVMALEGLLAVGFASAGWYSRLILPKWWNWSIILMLAIYLVGGYVTAIVSSSRGLTFLEDAVAFNFPFICAYWFVDRGMVDYTFPAVDSLQLQLQELKLEKEKYETLLRKGVIPSGTADQNLSLVRARIDVLERLALWLEPIGVELQAAQTDVSDFRTKLNLWKKEYNETGCGSSKNEIGILWNARCLRLARGVDNEWKVNDVGSGGLTDLGALKSVVATWLYWRRNKVQREFPLPKSLLKTIIQSIAKKEFDGEDIGPLTKQFDQHTISVFDSALIKKNLIAMKYQELVKHIRRYPSVEGVALFSQARSSLESSLTEFRKATEERIAGYEQLRRDEPDSYVVSQFEAFGGRFGVSMLMSNVKMTSKAIAKIVEQTKDIEEMADKLVFAL